MRTEERFEVIRPLLINSHTLLIVMQDSPDPDAIASAAALRFLALSLSEIHCTIAHGGQIGRSENQELVRYLGLHFRPLKDLEPSRFDLIAMVDTQPGTGNNSLPHGSLPDIVIDHHPVRPLTRRGKFADIRPRYGATSTILYEYLTVAGLTPDTKLSTTLLYGIRSDTQELGRDAISADTTAYLSLYPGSNKRALSRIQRSRLPHHYFRALHHALQSSRLYGSSLITPMGMIDHPDIIAEIADLLIRYEETDWVLCWGIHGGRILFSLRTCEVKANAGRMAQRIAGRLGSSGGHASMAGGQILLPEDGVTGELEKKITERFLRATGSKSQTPVSLLDPVSLQ